MRLRALGVAACCWVAASIAGAGPSEPGSAQNAAAGVEEAEDEAWWEKPEYRRRYTVKDLVRHAERGNLRRVGQILDAGLDINEFDERTFKNALIGAVVWSRREMIDYLLSHGADPNVLNEAELGVTQTAAARLQTDILDKLFEYGADVSEVRVNSLYTLVRAADTKCKHHNYERNIRKILGMGARQVLMSEQFPNHVGKDKREETPLMWASRCASLEVVKLLYANGGNVHVQDDNGKTALHYSVMSSNPRIMEFLLKVGANVNAKDDSFRTALNRAASIGELKKAKILMRHGASINEQDHFGRTAIGNAIVYCHHSKLDAIRIIRYLIKSGSDINIRDIDGMTPLMIASYLRNTYKEAAKLLIDAGADIFAKDDEGKTALDHSLESGNAEITKLLREEIEKRMRQPRERRPK